MLERSFRKIIFVIFTALILSFPSVSKSAMSSTNYYIYADSISVGGAFSSTGTLYELQDTTGEWSGGTASGTSSYIVKGGYQAMDMKYLSLNLSDNTLNIGTLDSTAAKRATTTATLQTDGDTGYTLSFTTVSGSHLANVSDGAVSGDGTEEYGFAASGTDSLISGDTAVSAPLNVASSNTYSTSTRQTTLVFKAARSEATAAGDYSQSITLTGAVNF